MTSSIFHTEDPINPRTGRPYRGAVFFGDRTGGDWSRIHCDQWSGQAEMYSLAFEDVFEVELGRAQCPWMSRTEEL